MITKSNKVSSYIYVYFYISIFCILNGGLFSYLTANTPFSYWRQFFTLLGFCLLFRASHFMYSSQLIRMQKYMLFIIYVLILFALYAYFYTGLNLIRIGYSFWLYISAFHMVLLPVISYMSGERFIYKIFSFFAMLGLLTLPGRRLYGAGLLSCFS